MPLRLLIGLGLTQTVGYGTIYYSFAILAPLMAADFGWPLERMFLILSVALLSAGFAAPLAGRMADRWGAARLMAGGSVAVALLFGFGAMAPSGLTFAITLIALELVGAFVLYNLAFVAVVQAAPHGARGRITHLTLIAGFASALFWPLTTALADLMGWRGVWALYGALNLILCLPVHMALARAKRVQSRSAQPEIPIAGRPLTAAELRVIARLLALGFVGLGTVMTAITIHMVPLLQALGLGASAVWIATLFGPAQVASRLINLIAGGRLAQTWLTLIAMGALASSIGVLALMPTIGGAVVFAILFGIGSGLSSIIMGTLPLELFGNAGYGGRVGRLSALKQGAGALSPALLAFAIGALGARVSLGLGFVIGALACAAFLGIALIARRAALR